MLKALCNRDGLLSAFGMVAGVVPNRSPKPILLNVKLTADADGVSTLTATDLEVGIHYRVLGINVEEPGSAILPTQKMQSILRASRDESLAVETDPADRLGVRGFFSEFDLPHEDPDLFPDVPDFTAASYHVVAAADLKRLIRRTMFATDTDSQRYALGGVLFEFGRESLSCIGTDGRRLAKATCPAEMEGNATAIVPGPVVPLKALKLIEKNLDADGPPVHLAVDAVSVLVRTERAVIYSRLVEGRFPRYQDVFPANVEVRIPMEVGALLSAVEQASIMTSEESRGVDFRFGDGVLRLSSAAADVGRSKVETAVDHDGPPVEITFDPHYLIDALKTLEPSATVTAELVDHKNAAVFRTEDGYSYVVMPLTRER